MKTEIPYNNIVKQLRKDASEEEMESVRLWIEESEDHRKLYKQMLKTWKLQDAFAFKPKKEEAWHKLDQHLVWKDVKQDRRIFLRRALQACAILIVILGIGFLLKPTGFIFGEKMLTFKTTNEQKTILLADGTEVFLNRNSKLSYPEVFNGEKRQVRITGEAFFKVARNLQKPFIIKTKKTQTQVLGTSFNLRAYAHEPSEVLTVTTGKVVFSSLSNKQSVILTPNQVGTYLRQDANINKHQLSDPNYMAWMTKIFVFDNQTLQSIVASLSSAYGTTIEINNERLAKEHLTTSFNVMKLDEVLIILSQTLGFEYNIAENEKIIIK